MKKGFGICMVLAVLMGTPFILTSCASGYERYQTPDSMRGLPNCMGLHMKNAQWYYNDSYGNRINVVGRCVQGMMHGNFNYSLNGNLVAKSKFTRGQEVKTTCLVGRKHPTLLNACMNEAASQAVAYRQGTYVVQQNQPVMVTVQQGSNAVMVPIQPGQAVVVPTQSGQSVMVPVQPGAQPVAAQPQQAQPVAAPAPQDPPAP